MKMDEKRKLSTGQIKEWLEALVILSENGKSPKEIAALGFDQQIQEAREIKARGQSHN